MSVTDYEERPFIPARGDDGTYDCGIEPNPFDGGKTETAWIDLVDDESRALRARAAVQVNRRPIPHTDDEERTFEENEVSVDLFEIDEGEDVPVETQEKLLAETNAVEILRGVCREEDQRDPSL